MSEKVKQFFVKASTEGLYLPVAHDAGKPSVTLFFMYLSNLLAVVSLALLHVKGDAFTATTTTAIYAVVQTVLYMFRRLQKAKFDLDDKSVELEGEEDDEESTQSNSST
jgi:hypothetical protein